MHPDCNRVCLRWDSFDHFANPAEEGDDPPRRSGVTGSVYLCARHPASRSCDAISTTRAKHRGLLFLFPSSPPSLGATPRSRARQQPQIPKLLYLCDLRRQWDARHGPSGNPHLKGISLVEMCREKESQASGGSGSQARCREAISGSRCIYYSIIIQMEGKLQKLCLRFKHCKRCRLPPNVSTVKGDRGYKDYFVVT